MEFPGSLRPLTQLWRQQQLLQITLFDEKARYQHLQESSDSQIDSLRQSRASAIAAAGHLAQAGEPDRYRAPALFAQAAARGNPGQQRRLAKGESAGKNGAAAKGAESQDEPEKGTALPVEPEDTYTPHPANKESHAQ